MAAWLLLHASLATIGLPAAAQDQEDVQDEAQAESQPEAQQAEADAALVAEQIADSSEPVWTPALEPDPCEQRLADFERSWQEYLSELQREWDVRQASRSQHWAKLLSDAGVQLPEELSAGNLVEDPWQEIERLRVELDAERRQRIQRESEWFAFTQSVAVHQPRLLESIRAERNAEQEGNRFGPLVPAVVTDPNLAGPSTAVTSSVSAAEQERSRQVFLSLRTMLKLEGVFGLDLLDAGQVHQGWVGPVVFRLLNERGQMVGTMNAQRLRLEGSRMGRSVTLVLEDGFESRAGKRYHFGSKLVENVREEDLDGEVASQGLPGTGTGAGAGGVRRIELPHVDPMAWVDRFPELFGDGNFGEAFAGVDDGEWNVERVRATLNELLAEDVENGYWRVRVARGVWQNELRDVHLEAFDRDGNLERRLFADGLQLFASDRGVGILLRDGVQIRGDRKAPFLEGRYRIFLPRADRNRWLSANLPGLRESGANELKLLQSDEAQGPGSNSD